MRIDTGWLRAAALAAAALAAAALAGPAAAEDAIPRNGDDAVILADGRVLRCRAGQEAGGKVDLAFPGGTLSVPAADIAEIRRFADYDPAPRTDEEKAKAAAGLVRFAGEWIPPGRRDEVLRQARAKAQKLWQESAAHLVWENRWKRATAHFAIEADIPAKALDGYAQALEAFYDYFTSALKVSPKKRIPVYICRTREEFRDFQRKDTGSVRENTVGYFVPQVGDEHLVLFDWQGDRAETMRVMLHETTHLLIYLANPAVRLPTMINEGLAEYYGASVMRKGKMIRGGMQENRMVNLRALIEEGRLPPLEEVFAHGHADRAAPGWKRYTVDDYAIGWAFMHFLFHGADGRYQPRLLLYLNAHWALKFKDAAPGGSKDYYGMKFSEDRDLLLRMLKVKDFETLQKEFLDYQATLRIEGAQALAEQGFHYLRAARRRPRAGETAPSEGARNAALEKAEAAFREALAKAGDDPDLLAILVRGFSLLDGKEKEAGEILLRALELDPLNLQMRWELSGLFPDEDTEIPHLRLLAEMAPDDPVGIAARAWLGYRGVDGDRYAEPFGSSPEEALAAAQRAALAAPADPAAWEALAERASQGSPAEFVRALEGFRKAAEGAAKAEGPAAVAAVENRVSRVLVESLCGALAAGKPAEARQSADAWYKKTAADPRTEAEWLLHVGLAVKTKDMKTFLARLQKAAQAVPGSERLVFLVRGAGEDLAPGGGGGGDDGGN